VQEEAEVSVAALPAKPLPRDGRRSDEAAVRIAMRECVRPWWKGPLITSRTVCEVTMCYPPHTKWTIKASDVISKGEK
jgi:hypothetical protein